MAPSPSRESYTIGWICALAIELTAAQILLDDEYDVMYSQNERDTNVYTYGRIGAHHVVVAALPDGEVGTGSAATVAAKLLSSFPKIRVGLMVGIGGGVPSVEDVRLGDVVVSRMEKGYGGVIQYDFGKTKAGSKEYTGFLDAPPAFVRSAVTTLRSHHNRRRTLIPEYLLKLQDETDGLFKRGQDDRLFESDYDHVNGHDCDGCDPQRLVPRAERNTYKIHYGTIASGNQVMKSAEERDRISELFKGVLCFEMEAAGLLNSFPCLVIRGISDYCDSHNNDDWHEYAAGVAAAYAKDLLMVIPAASAARAKPVEESTRQRIFQSPISQDRHFVGREKIIRQLQQKLFVEKACSRFAIVGLGGIGKTQVAVSLAHKVQKLYPEYDILWLSAVSKQTIDQGCSEIARLLDIQSRQDGNIKPSIKERLSHAAAGNFLLIIDSADDMRVLQETELCGSLPNSGVVLWITRTHEVAQFVADNDYITIEQLSAGEGVELLSTVMSVDRSEQGLPRLLKLLDYLPVAIIQAANYMNLHKITITDFLRLLEATQQDKMFLMDYAIADNTRQLGTDSTAFLLWHASIQRLIEDENAAKILEFLSCIEYKAVPTWMLPRFKTESQLRTALGLLCSYSFITQTRERIDMNRLVHLATRRWYERADRSVRLRHDAICHLREVLPECSWDNMERWRSAVPHIAKLERETCDGSAVARSWLYIQVGRFMRIQGRAKEYASWCRKAENCTSALPASDDSRYTAQHELALSCLDNGQVDEARSLMQDIIAIQTKTLPKKHPHRLASQHTLAMVCIAKRQYKQAIDLLKPVVTIRAQRLPTTDCVRLSSEYQLATAYLHNGQTERATSLLQHVVQSAEKALPSEHPERLAFEVMLASAHRKTGRSAEAVMLCEHIAQVRSVLPEDHTSRLLSQHHLAQAYDADNRASDAIELLETLLPQNQRVLGHEHQNTLSCMQLLATIYVEQGRLDDAEAMFRSCYDARHRLLGPAHADTENSHTWLLRTQTRKNIHATPSATALESTVPKSARLQKTKLLDKAQWLPQHFRRQA